MMIVNPIVKKRVLLRGPVLTQSGYGVHTRQIAKWLMSREDLDVDVQALPWGDTPWLVDGKIDGGFVGKLLEKTTDPTGKVYDASVQVQLPNEWDPRLAKLNIGITAGVETDRCNPTWTAACNTMSMVIVPSRHAASSLTTPGEVKVPLHVVPEAYSEAIPTARPTAIDEIDLSTSFNFLVFGQLTGNNPENDRKNIFYTVKWLCEVFEKDPEVGIVVKTNAGRNTRIDRKFVTQTFENLLKEVRRGPHPRLHLVHGDLDDAEVASLYRHPKIKALVSLTRGEGYGLPILEAAAAGLPVVATSWSGHTDFLSHGRYIEIPYKLSDVHPSRIDDKIFMKGSRWASPSEEEFKRKILKFRESPVVPQGWASELRERIEEKYSLKSVISRYDEVTRGII